MLLRVFRSLAASPALSRHIFTLQTSFQSNSMAAPSSSSPDPAAVEEPSAGSSKKVIIAVDLDEVLASFLTGLTNFHNSKHNTRFQLKDYLTYHFGDTWGGEPDAVRDEVLEFFESDEFMDIRPIDGAAEVLRKNASRFSYHIVTSRQVAIEEKTKHWLKLHFPGVFDGVHFGNHYSGDDGGRARSKAEICKEIGASILIDDSIHHTVECAQSGLKAVILFGHYRWNRFRPKHDGSAEGAAAGRSADAHTAITETNPASLPNLYRAEYWYQLDKLLNRVTRDGTIADMPSLTVATRSRPESYEQVVRMTLQHQEALDVTAVAQGIPVLTTVVASLLRSGEARCISTQTCLDHAHPGQPRLPRLSVQLARTDKLREHLLEHEVEQGVKAEADVAKRRVHTGAEEGEGDPVGEDRGEESEEGEEEDADPAAAGGGGGN